MAKRCTAHSKQTGEPCGNRPAKGKDVCRFHGAKSTGAKDKAKASESKKGNQSATKHGIFASVIPEKYKPVHDETREAPAAEVVTDTAALMAAKLAQAYDPDRELKGAAAKVAAKIDKMIADEEISFDAGVALKRKLGEPSLGDATKAAKTIIHAIETNKKPDRPGAGADLATKTGVIALPELEAPELPPDLLDDVDQDEEEE